MPWHVERRGGKHCVIKNGTRESEGCHMTRPEAVEQVQALYANEPKEQGKSFSVFKDSKNQLRWLMISSTAHRDRDGEIVSLQALKEDVARNTGTSPLRWWHVPGVDIGDCDTRVVIAGSLVESGTFRNETIGQRVAKKAHDLECSIGFRHPTHEPDVSGVFHTIEVFERSLVPRGRAANPFTKVVVKETTMTDEKIKALGDLINDQGLLEQLISLASATKEVSDTPVRLKEDDEGKVFLGDLTPEAFIELTAKLLTPITAELNTVKELISAQSTTKSTEAAEQNKEADATRAALAEARRHLGILEARLKSLEGEQPRVNTVRATESPANIVTEETVKGLLPKDDPFAKHVNAVMSVIGH